MRTAAVGARGARGAAALASGSGGHAHPSALGAGAGAGRQQQQRRLGARPSSSALRLREGGASLGAPSKRGVATRVIPSLIGDANTQPPPDLPSFLFKERIVYLGMTLVPSVTELLVAELLYLQFEDAQKPIYFYINSTGTTKQSDKMAYDAEAFAIYDTLSYVKNPVYTVCVGTAWGEAAMLLAAGEKGHRAALPSSTIMIKEPIATKRGQVSPVTTHTHTHTHSLSWFEVSGQKRPGSVPGKRPSDGRNKEKGRKEETEPLTPSFIVCLLFVILVHSQLTH